MSTQPWAEIKDKLRGEGGELNIELIKERWGDLEGVAAAILDETVEREERVWLLRSMFEGNLNYATDLEQRIRALEQRAQ